MKIIQSLAKNNIAEILFSGTDVFNRCSMRNNGHDFFKKVNKLTVILHT
jgi:hypothetical protein